MKMIACSALLVCAAWLPAVAGEPSPETLARAEVLTRAMQYEYAFDDSLAVCREKVQAEDLATVFAKSPQAFGGISPDDAQWPEARGLYLEMLAKGCSYARAPAVASFADALATSLDAADLDALIAFYDTELGQRFLRASHTANRAAALASSRLPESETAYEDYTAALAALVAKRGSPATEPAATPVLARTVRALPSANEAVALSDRMLQRVGQDPPAAFALLRPHSIIAEASMDTLEVSLVNSMPTAEAQYGGTIGHELLRNDSVGDSVMRVTFLQRRVHYGMSWQFLWYRAEDGWVLAGFRFADDLGALF